MGLYTYQEELQNIKEEKIVINWCRGAGKDYAIARYILDKGIKKVGVFGRFEIKSLLSAFEELKEEYNLSIESILEGNLNRINNSNKVIELYLLSTTETKLENYDLVIGHTYKEIECKKHIISTTTNKYTGSYFLSDLESRKYQILTVDYREAISVGAINNESVVQSALQNNSNSFYREYALNDKVSEEVMEFDEFTEAALLRLQKQFLSTSDTKDTVLTRKNIIEMIKDIKEMSLHQSL